MDRAWYQRFIAVVVLLVGAIYYSLPSLIYFTAAPEQRRSEAQVKKLIPAWLPDTRFNLGIDLQGGLHLVMGVDTEKAVQDTADRFAGAIADQMAEKGKPMARARRDGEAPELRLVLGNENDGDALREVLGDSKEDWVVRSRSGTETVVAMTDARRDQIRTDAVDQALKTIRNRIDQTGVKEPEVRRRGDSSILIQLAGLSLEDQDFVRDNVIGRTAQLEFKIVDETDRYFETIAAAPDRPASVTLNFDQRGSASRDASNRPFLVGTNREELKKFLESHRSALPAEREVGVQEFRAAPGAPPQYQTYLLDRRPGITGDYLENAFPSFNAEDNSYEVNMRFDRKGAVLFEKLTRANVGRQMAIVLDGTVDSAPVIQGPIPGGTARITLGGAKTQQEILADARALSLVLKAGALPAPVFVQEERTVGATLGDDAISKGQLALVVALVSIFAFMTVYYRASGAVGVTALVVNMVFLFAALAIIGVTLTLPGIAGLVLTIGMAVDANIIQFERIREELLAGKSVRAAVDAGFEKAFSAIFDANVTTLLACVVLGQFGSGPIRGFAVTLGVGVVINTFTALVVPRLGLDYFTRGLRVKALSI